MVYPRLSSSEATAVFGRSVVHYYCVVPLKLQRLHTLSVLGSSGVCNVYLGSGTSHLKPRFPAYLPTVL